jgi:hypothetical protein
MAPCYADLFNVEDGQNLGVEVADGHIIKCSKERKANPCIPGNERLLKRYTLNEI